MDIKVPLHANLSRLNNFGINLKFSNVKKGIKDYLKIDKII